MSQGIWTPGKEQPVNLEFGCAVQPDGSIVVRVSGNGFVVHWPPMAPEHLQQIAANLSNAAAQILAKRKAEIERLSLCNGQPIATG